MSKIADAEVWIGRTRTQARYRVYVIGKKPSGTSTVWILGSAEARQGGLSGFAEQGSGFPDEASATAFARTAFGSPGRLSEFTDHELNPLSLRRADAPILISKVDLS